MHEGRLCNGYKEPPPAFIPLSPPPQPLCTYWLILTSSKLTKKMEFCIMLGQLYLTAYSANNFRLEANPTLHINYGPVWNLIDGNGAVIESIEASPKDLQICNVKYENCIAMGKDRTPENYELLFLEAPDEPTLWNFDLKSGIVFHSNYSEFFWDAQHKKTDREPLQLFHHTTVSDIPKFQAVPC